MAQLFNTIGKLQKEWCLIELFFKWIKQHLRIKKFYGTSENAVKVQIWTAVSVYVLVAIIKKRLDLDVSLYILLLVFSVTLFEKIPLNKDFFDANQILEADIWFCRNQYDALLSEGGLELLSNGDLAFDLSGI